MGGAKAGQSIRWFTDGESRYGQEWKLASVYWSARGYPRDYRHRKGWREGLTDPRFTQCCYLKLGDNCPFFYKSLLHGDQVSAGFTEAERRSPDGQPLLWHRS